MVSDLMYIAIKLAASFNTKLFLFLNSMIRDRSEAIFSIMAKVHMAKEIQYPFG